MTPIEKFAVQNTAEAGIKQHAHSVSKKYRPVSHCGAISGCNQYSCDTTNKTPHKAIHKGFKYVDFLSF
jgi:hypothetical protein